MVRYLAGCRGVSLLMEICCESIADGGSERMLDPRLPLQGAARLQLACAGRNLHPAAYNLGYVCSSEGS